jgi:hypothetical protein
MAASRHHGSLRPHFTPHICRAAMRLGLRGSALSNCRSGMMSSFSPSVLRQNSERISRRSSTTLGSICFTLLRKKYLPFAVASDTSPQLHTGVARPGSIWNSPFASLLRLKTDSSTFSRVNFTICLNRQLASTENWASSRWRIELEAGPTRISAPSRFS